MPADVPLYQAILAQIQASTTGCGVRRSAAKRLALLVTGIVAARSSVLAQVAAELWAGARVVVLADRAFDIPTFVDRITARGWHWVVRLKANGTSRFRDHLGREHGVRDLVRRHVARPGQRWKAHGQVFKKAGWRPASVVALWAAGQAEPLVVLTDLPPRWEVLKLYGRRFWIEAGFRTDKTK